MPITNIPETRAQLSPLIERVPAGEEVIIGRAGKAGKPAARLVRFERPDRPRRPLSPSHRRWKRRRVSWVR